MSQTNADQATENYQKDLSIVKFRLDTIENTLNDLKKMLEFIHKERTSPRGRIDAMMTNTQLILDNIVKNQKDVTTILKTIQNVHQTVNHFGDEISELKSLQFHFVNLTDEITKLRIEIYRQFDEKNSESAY